MNNTIKTIAIFTVGIGAGVIASWKFFEAKYKKIADEEIASVKMVYSKKAANKTETTHDEIENELANVDHASYNKMLNELGYSKDNPYKKEEGEITIVGSKPYVIPPEDFDEGDYVTETLTYYADGVLTDDFDNVIEDVESLVGEDSLKHFGEYEDDAVYVRNDACKTEYEILLDVRKYADIPKYKMAYPGDDE